MDSLFKPLFSYGSTVFPFFLRTTHKTPSLGLTRNFLYSYKTFHYMLTYGRSLIPLSWINRSHCGTSINYCQPLGSCTTHNPLVPTCSDCLSVASSFFFSGTFFSFSKYRVCCNLLCRPPLSNARCLLSLNCNHSRAPFLGVIFHPLRLSYFAATDVNMKTSLQRSMRQLL